MPGIARFYDAVAFVRRRLNPDFAMPQLAILLYAAQHEGMTMSEIGEHLGMPTGSLSRNVKQLSRYSVREGGKR